MRALALRYTDRTLSEVARPEPALAGRHDVLLRVLEIGVCGTDRGLIQGRFGRPPAGEEQLVLGHEALCEVLAVGSQVAAFKPGDLVAPMIRRACDPACRFCAVDRRDLCFTGAYTERGIIGAHGYFAELAVDKEQDLVPIPGELRDAAVLMEPLSVVEKAVRMALHAYPGTPERALVIGAGPIGILCALVLLSRGIDVIVHSLEPANSPRARWLVECGAAYCHADPPDADIAIEAAGAPHAGFLAVSKLRPAGVAVILGAGNASGDFPFHDLIAGNRTVLGVVNADRAAFQDAANDLHRIGVRRFTPLVERIEASRWRRSLLSDEPGTAPKWVHVW
ncbi:MAG: alcohol dehydrogenase catalytic domain-containing protein [Acidobacteria bacterium]|nr:alcohol dehydrogenase catalytic domain-containing protein [Acidobacteriota bacterium]